MTAVIFHAVRVLAERGSRGGADAARGLRALTGGYEAGLVALALSGAAALLATARWRDPRGVRARMR